MFISVVVIAFWCLVTLAGLTGVVASVNNIRFRQRVGGEVAQVLKTAAEPRRIDGGDLETLPAPVRHYLEKAGGTHATSPRSATLRQTGTFRPDLNGQWYPIKAEQYLTFDPPGFIWWGRLRMGPGIWIDARDRSVAGAGSMLVMAESTIGLADAAGPALDQGALLRLLGELTLMPTAFLDNRYVRWSAIDDRHALAVFTVAGRTATGSFEFGQDGLPVRFRAERFRDLGGGKTVLTPFLGEYLDYRTVEGMLVPHQIVGSWVVDGRPFPYARFNVASIGFAW